MNMFSPKPDTPIHLLSGLRGRVTSKCILVEANEPWLSIGSGVLGGGIGTKLLFLNRQVSKNYDACNPNQEMTKWLEATLPFCQIDACSALMTAAWVSHGVWAQLACGTQEAVVITTAGLSNACAAGLTVCFSQTKPCPGTINIMAFLSHSLTPGGLVNAVQTITEAKTRTLGEMGVRCLQSGFPATGTGTDAVIVAGNPKGPLADYAGPTTVTGCLLANGVQRTLTGAIQKYCQAISDN
ncbi:protein of unknown function DUF105 [Desulforamulus reducens MI-1]|uniref:Adenosylcobinamide amidohydrolase n=1 Tax=Desulforamulus reducens (strain ATCC BAA-1160 / DSM 100696 / MI-1) TaxID=349161 RepID=A4J7Y4_DESRM|nr:adenosylcobinamide amidohydrolase [Desulforamulus reducens]ABO51187.1 protein of unknown function DUF105 [Desulforamulus reducens MI-1]